MTENSYICQYMASHPNWRDELLAKGIQTKENGNLVILNYGVECDFADPIVQEARGIIIDTEALEVVCWPFRKFGNFGESYADEIDWSIARVQEKIDGSIVKLWYNRDHWHWSTNSMIDAAEAHVMDGSCSFMDLIRRAEGYGSIRLEQLDISRTNGAAAIFYPGVMQKMLKIMGGPYQVIFMNVNDIMIFGKDDQMAYYCAQTAKESSKLGEKLSEKMYLCDGKRLNTGMIVKVYENGSMEVE